MSISDLINNVGDKNISIQWISQCITGACEKKKCNLTEIKVLTNAINTSDLLNITDSKNVGIIVWIPRSLIPENLRPVV